MKEGLKILLACTSVMLLSIMPAHAQKVVTGSKELPLELNLLVDFLQKDNPNTYNRIFPVIYGIDTFARSLSKEDIFIVGKVEVYKTLLKNSGPRIKTTIDGNTTATLQKALAKTNDLFLKWFLTALLKDAQDLMRNPLYKEFVLQKNNNLKLEKNDYKKLEKKSELLQFWISKISPTADNFPETMTEALRPKLLEALNNIQRSYYLMSSESSMSPNPVTVMADKDLKFFNVIETTVKAPSRPAPSPEKSKSVEEILAPITDEKSPDLPRPSQENWLQEQNAPSSIQNLPKPSNDADWLQDF